ncbi:MAG: hypothetical protein Q9168_004501 [Polycauliona sp. 1 TL-2023]
MPDPFALLPLPLPIFILNDFEDLASLHAVLVTSPIAYRIFNTHFIEILSSVLPHYPEHLLDLFRTILAVRSEPGCIRAKCSASPLDSFDIFYATIVDKSPEGTIAELSKTTTTVTATRSFVKTAAQVQGLMNGFFETHLERLNKLRPHGARNQKNLVMFNDQWTPLPSTEFVPYEIMPCEQQSWIEENRVLRALWRMAIWFDMLHIIAPIRDGKNEEDSTILDDVWKYLKTLKPSELWLIDARTEHARKGTFYSSRGATTWQEQEMDCIINFLKEVSHESPHPANTTIDDSGPQFDLQALPTTQTNCYTTPLPVSQCCEKTALMWRQGTHELKHESPGNGLFHQQKHVQAADEKYTHGLDAQNSLTVCPFEFLQPLGFVIWDGEKLARLGLAYIDIWPRELKDGYLLGPPPLPEEGPRTEGPTRFELVIRWRSLFIGHTS